MKDDYAHFIAVENKKKKSKEIKFAISLHSKRKKNSKNYFKFFLEFKKILKNKKKITKIISKSVLCLAGLFFEVMINSGIILRDAGECEKLQKTQHWINVSFNTLFF